MKKRLLALALGVVLALGAAGCGDTQAASSNGGSGSGDGGVTKVVVAVESGSNPLSFIDDDGNVVGYEVDVLKAIDEIVPEYEFEIDIVDGSATVTGLQSGQYALIGGGLYKTAEREAQFLLPDAICGASTIKAYVRSDDDSIHSLDDVVDKKVTPVSPGGGIHNLLLEYNDEHPDAPITIEPASDDLGADARLRSVASGEYDVYIIPDNLGTLELIEELGLDLKEVENPVKVNGTFFVLAQGQEDLRDKVNDALVTLRENGTLTELNIKWYGEDKIAYYQD